MTQEQIDQLRALKAEWLSSAVGMRAVHQWEKTLRESPPGNWRARATSVPQTRYYKSLIAGMLVVSSEMDWRQVQTWST